MAAHTGAEEDAGDGGVAGKALHGGGGDDPGELHFAALLQRKLGITAGPGRPRRAVEADYAPLWFVDWPRSVLGFPRAAYQHDSCAVPQRAGQRSHLQVTASLQTLLDLVGVPDTSDDGTRRRYARPPPARSLRRGRCSQC